MLETKTYSSGIVFKIRDEIHPDLLLCNLVSNVWTAIRSVPTDKEWDTFLPGNEIKAENGSITEYNVYLAYRFDGFRDYISLPPGVQVTYSKKEGHEHEIRFYSEAIIDGILGGEVINEIADNVFAVCEDYFSQN